MRRFGVIEFSIFSSPYIDFCRTITGSQIDVIGIYYTTKKEEIKIEFLDWYSGEVLLPKYKVDIRSLSSYRDITTVRMRAFRQVTAAKILNITQCIFNILTREKNANYSCLFGKELTGRKIVCELEKDCELSLGTPTIISSSATNSNLFDFSSSYQSLSRWLILNPSKIFKRRKYPLGNVLSLIELISDADRELSEVNVIPHIDWNKISQLSREIGDSIGVSYPTVGKERVNSFIILSENIEHEGRSYPLTDPDLIMLDKTELVSLIEHIQVMIDQGNTYLMSFQAKIIDSLSVR